MERGRVNVRYGPKATKLLRRGDLLLCAKSGREQVQQTARLFSLSRA